MVTAARRLTEAGLLVSIDHLGEDTTERADAERVVTEYVTLLTRLSDAGLAGSTEVSVKLTALGQALGDDGPDDRPWRTPPPSAGPPSGAGTMVTLDMEDHTTTDATLETLAELRKEFPDTGAVLQAYLRRTEARLPRPRVRRVPGPAVQGRVRRTGECGLPRRARGRPVLRALPEGPDGRRGLSDAGHPRSDA